MDALTELEPSLYRDRLLDELGCGDYSELFSEEYEGVPRELKLEYPLLEEEGYFDRHTERIDILKDVKPELAVVEICSYFEEAARRTAIQDPDIDYYDEWVEKESWPWRYELRQLVEEEEYRLLDSCYDIRGDYLHGSEERDWLEISTDARDQIERLFEVYDRYSPVEVPDTRPGIIPVTLPTAELVIRKDVDEHTPLALQRDLERSLLDNFDFSSLGVDIPDRREGRFEFGTELAFKLGLLSDRDLSTVEEAREYRDDMVHGVEPDRKGFEREFDFRTLREYSKRIKELDASELEKHSDTIKQRHKGLDISCEDIKKSLVSK